MVGCDDGVDVDMKLVWPDEVLVTSTEDAAIYSIFVNRPIEFDDDAELVVVSELPEYVGIYECKTVPDCASTIEIEPDA